MWILNAITLKEGKMITDMLSTEFLYINTYDAAKLELKAQASYIELNMEGNSSGDFNLDSDSLNIALRDRIDTRIYAVSESNTIKMEKNASAKIEGTTNVFLVELQENANLKAEDLEAANINLMINKSASAKIYAYENLELTAKGASKTFLHGTPKIIIHEFLDTSELHKEKD